MNKNLPAVSIVIPMYNTEKYVGECLDSILAQTFTDFEVIVVDDCSTDKSIAVVESYLPKFNSNGGGVDKLRIIRRKVNSGGGGFPKNMGLSISRGEYIYFIDSDDIIKNTALEELYPIAKKFDADVVHCDRYFEFSDDVNSSEIKSYQTGEFVQEPTLITENIAERLKDLYNVRFMWNLWTKLIRRDLMIENDLKMIDHCAYEDALFTAFILCTAKNYVRVPNIVNYYRYRKESISHMDKSLLDRVIAGTNNIKNGFHYFNKIFKENEFFKNHPECKNWVMEFWLKLCEFLDIYHKVPAHQIEEVAKREFEKVLNDAALTAFFFNRMNIFHAQLNRQNSIVNQMNAYIQKQNQFIKQQQDTIQKQNQAIQQIQNAFNNLQK